MFCVFCGNDSADCFEVKSKPYYRCNSCGGIFMSEKAFLSPAGQKERYEKHNNSLEDSGYCSFLRGFIEPVLAEVKNRNGSLKTILDYGSGPEPALVHLLEKLRDDKILPTDSEIRGWDPFFAPETPLFSSGADLVTSLEVVEHFEKPLESMKKLAEACKKGGFAAIGTMLLPFQQDESNWKEKFSSWWYRSDATHVSFYTKKALCICAERSGLSFVTDISDRCFLFRKA